MVRRSTAAAGALGGAVDAQRAYLYAVDGTERVAAQWHRPEVPPVPVPDPPGTPPGEEPVVDGDRGHLPAPLAGFLSAAGARTYALVPFGTADGLWGGVLVAGTAEREWSAEKVAFLEAAGTDLARALAQVRLDEQQQELVGQLRELNQRRTDFVNMVSHDLRNPLTSILTYTEELGEDTRLTPSQQAALAVIARNTRRVTGMAEELLALARAEAGPLPLAARPVRLAELAGDVAATLGPLAASGGLSLAADVPPELWVEGDPDQLRRALLDLVGNAVKFTPPGGRVEITGRQHYRGLVQLTVRDTGIGIPEADQAGLFEPFRRAGNATTAAIPGTGLGLAIVRAVVQQHHGTVTIESTEDVGTAVTVTLPACPAERYEPATEPAVG